jgi:hypothetical protein
MNLGESGGGRRAVLERQANDRISHLIPLFDALNHRRHAIQEVGRDVSKVAVATVAALAYVAVAAAAVLVGARYVERRRRRRRLAFRIGKWLETLA